jgi:putative glutamine amidotransferase
MSDQPVVVGLTTYFESASWGLWNTNAALIPHWYLDLFHNAGAQVVLLPPGTDTQVLNRLDGLVIAGGADVDARLYGEPSHETADVPRESRDATEVELYRAAQNMDVPFLGICRGAQVMAVARGGALHQHLPDITDVVHKEHPLVFVEHEARLEEGTRIAEIFESKDITVNSFHHQAIKNAGDLTISAWAPDETVEVVEDPAASFSIGVQWHPEHPDRREADRPLIDAFLVACRTRQASRR